MRAVLDPNVLIAALLSPTGAPAQIVARWLAGEFDLVVSESLLAELERALAHRKPRALISAVDAAAFVALLANTAVLAPDPAEPEPRSPDPGDDYLIALAESEHAILVSGDGHVLGLADRFPIRRPRTFLELLEADNLET